MSITNQMQQQRAEVESNMATDLAPIEQRPSKAAAICFAVFAVVYLLSPIDLCPEIPFGPFGLIDDVLVIVAAYKKFQESLRK